MGKCSCGSDLREGALFCQSCGTRVEKVRYCALCGQINPAHFDDTCPSCSERRKTVESGGNREEADAIAMEVESEAKSDASPTDSGSSPVKVARKRRGTRARGLIFAAASVAAIVAAMFFVPRSGPVEVIFVNQSSVTNPIIGSVTVKVSNIDSNRALNFNNSDKETAVGLGELGWISTDALKLDFLSSFSQDEKFTLEISTELMGSSLLDASSPLKIFVVMTDNQVTFSLWSNQFGQFGKRLEVSHPRGNEKQAVARRVELLKECRELREFVFEQNLSSYLTFEDDYLAAVKDANLMTWHGDDEVWLYYSTWASRMKKLVASLDELVADLRIQSVLVPANLKNEASTILHYAQDLRDAWEGLRQDARAERKWTHDDEMFDAYYGVGTGIDELESELFLEANSECQAQYPEID
jgi:hypothetical protein